MNSQGKKYIVTGIGTDIGKTVVSAILAQALEATYWKPIQSGELDNSDSHKVANLTNDKVTVLPEIYRLSRPLSPHIAASSEGIIITKEHFHLPEISGNLIIEGAGGLMVPLNDQGDLLIDVFQSWNLPVIVVSRHYLGSINHTLLTIEALNNRNIPIENYRPSMTSNSVDIEKEIRLLKQEIGKLKKKGR